MPDQKIEQINKESHSKVSESYFEFYTQDGKVTVDTGYYIEPELTVINERFKAEIRGVLNNYENWLAKQRNDASICYDKALIKECHIILDTNRRLKKLRDDLEKYIKSKLMPRRGFLERFSMAFNRSSKEPYDLTLHLVKIMEDDFYKFDSNKFELEEKELRDRELKGGYTLTHKEHNDLVDNLKNKHQLEIDRLNQKIARLTSENDNSETEAINMKARAERAEAENVKLMAELKKAQDQINILTRENTALKNAQYPNSSQYGQNRPDCSYKPNHSAFFTGQGLS